LVPFLQATEVDTDAVLVEHIRLSASGTFSLGEMVFIREGVFLAVERFGDTVGGELLTVLFIGAFTAAAGIVHHTWLFVGGAELGGDAWVGEGGNFSAGGVLAFFTYNINHLWLSTVSAMSGYFL